MSADLLTPATAELLDGWAGPVVTRGMRDLHADPTAITVAVSYVHLGAIGNLIVAMAVATVKGTLVALFFMHLLYDNKLYLIVFLGSLLFLGVFIAFTLADTQRRGDIYEMQAVPRQHPPLPAFMPGAQPAGHGDAAAPTPAAGGDAQAAPAAAPAPAH